MVASVVVILIDGVRPDVLATGMDRGELPALARLRAEGASETIATCFPSVTGAAYTPLLMGRFPGPVGLPGLRWFDRARTAPHVWGAGQCRSYIGLEAFLLDRDLDPAAPTLFELARPSLGALSVIQRGLPARNRIGSSGRLVARAAWAHARGNLRDWLRFDRDVGQLFARRLRAERPSFAYLAITGVDKASHTVGHASALVQTALAEADALIDTVCRDAERDGTWDRLFLCVASDHGHAPVSRHDDLAVLTRALGYSTRAHPFAWRGGLDVAVMVSGNAMANLYLELGRRERPWWPALTARWMPLVETLLARDSVDLVLLPMAPERCEVRGRGRGSAIVVRDGGRYRYEPVTGDPLGIGAQDMLDDEEACEVCRASAYPDAIVQIAHLAGASRSGDIILSAAPGWDFRERYEPVPHVSTHGSLHRDHMLVPLVVNRRPGRTPRRTTDVMATACAALGLAAPKVLDGRSFLAPDVR